MGFRLPSSLARRFDQYEADHQTIGNRRTHFIGIPAVVIATLGLFAGIQLPFGDAAMLLLAIACFWYLIVDWKVSIPFSSLLIGIYFLAKSLPTDMLWFLFIAGWIFQILGHAIWEKRRPAFLSNLSHLLFAPLWYFTKITRFYDY